MRILVVVLAGAGLALAAAAALAGPPLPLGVPGLQSFPGAFLHPASAASAGCALADRWLGDEPFDNPAAVTPGGVMVAPALVRLRRQDLAARYAWYDQTPAFVHAAGGWLSFQGRRGGIFAYAAEPVLRREDLVFSGETGGAAGTYAARVTARETRIGLGLSVPWRAARAGAAIEWSRRSDEYDFEVSSGDPLAGVHHLEHSGSGTGWQVGVRAAAGPRAVVGAALRRLPRIAMDGRRTLDAAMGEAFDADRAVRGTRAAAWEGGVSARVSITPAVHALAGVGGRGAQAWEGYDVTAGPAFSWSAGVAWSDEREPWEARAGFGQEQQRGVPEPRAGLAAVGLGWRSGALRVDLGGLHRSLRTPGGTTSPDDRVVAGATILF